MPEPAGPIPPAAAGATVLEEVAVSVYLNGRHFTAAMTVPDRLADLAVGLLVTEQAIRSIDELASIREDGPCVRAMTLDPFRVVVPRRGVITGCGGAASHLSEKRVPRLPPAPPVPVARVRAALAAAFDPPAGLFRAVLLADGAASSDDLGLGTALARVVGAAVARNEDRAGAVAALSHRATAELARAAAVAGVPVLASAGPVTRLAVQVAERSGLCLCGTDGDGGIACHAHPERLGP